MDVAGSEVVDEPRIGGRGAAEILFDTLAQRSQIVLGRAQIIAGDRRRPGIRRGLERVLEHRLAGRGRGCGPGGGQGALRVGGGAIAGTVPRLGLLVELPDPGFQLGDLGGQLARTFGNGIDIFFEPEHASRQRRKSKIRKMAAPRRTSGQVKASPILESWVRLAA